MQAGAYDVGRLAVVERDRQVFDLDYSLIIHLINDNTDVLNKIIIR